MLSKDVLRFDLNLVFVEYANRKYAASPISHTLSPCTLLQGQSPACKHHSASLSAASQSQRVAGHVGCSKVKMCTFLCPRHTFPVFSPKRMWLGL